MIKKKKFPQIHPAIVKDQNGKAIEVYLKYDEYKSIFEEIDELKIKISELKEKKSQKNS